MEQAKKLTRADFELQPPGSLREIIQDELVARACDDLDKRQVEAITEEVLDKLMPRVYARIEREALAVYKSNEPWALKAYVYSVILKDVVASEATGAMADNLIAPVVEWQQRDFNPIASFRDRLGAERKSPHTIRGYMGTAARFVSRMGRKAQYTDSDVLEYLTWANKRYPNQNTYLQEWLRLREFLRRLPGADRHRDLPMAMPKAPTEFYQPTLTEQQIETLVWAAVIDDIEADMVVRLLVASIYGGRASELARLSSADFNLDHGQPTIFIRTGKHGQRKPQVIPIALLPLFQAPIQASSDYVIRRRLKQICKRAGVLLPKGGGYHSFRRRTATVVSEIEPSDTNASSFMRWAKPTAFSMLARYKQTPVEVTDTRILDKHPFVRMWAEAVPHILKFNSHYASLFDNNTYCWAGKTGQMGGHLH